MSDTSKQSGLLIRKFHRNNGSTQKDFAQKTGYSRTYIPAIATRTRDISEIVTGSREISEDIKVSFSNKFGFEIEDLLKTGLVAEKQAKYHKSEKGKLYDVENLSQERIDIIQEMIDNWKAEDARKRKEERRKRAYKTKSKKTTKHE